MSAPAKLTSSLGIKPLSIVRMLWKRKILIVFVWIVFSFVVTKIVATLPSIYMADALVVIDSQKVSDKLISSIISADVQDRNLNLTNLTQRIFSTSRLMQ